MLLTACSHGIYTHKSWTKCFSLGTFSRLHFGDLFLQMRKNTYCIIIHTSYATFCSDVLARPSGIIVSALASGSSSPGSSPGQGNCVVFLGKTLHSHSVSLSTEVYKWVLPNLLKGVTMRWTSITSMGE